MGDNWQVTAQMYSSLFEKPKMSEKLLCKPPFKYIFDILHETMKLTSFAEGLLEGEELDPAYYTDKDRKILYLEKFIGVTSSMQGETIQAKASKIVAGVEPEKTNEFLQAVYRAAVSGEDSGPHVAKVLNKKGSAPAEETKKEEKAPKKQEETKKPKAEPKAEPKSEPKAEPKPEPKAEPTQQQPTQQQRVRPPSARKGPPSVKDNTTVESSKKNAPSVILEDKKKDDDADHFVTNNKPVSKTDLGNIQAEEHGQFVRDAMKQSEEQQPEAKQEEQQQSKGIKMTGLRTKAKQKAPAEAAKAEGLKNIIPDLPDAGTGAALDDIEILQKIIQSVTQNTNPLKKSLDFMNDDIESMNKEMERWRNEYLQSKEKYQSELRSTEEALQPMMDKLADIDEQIKDKKSKIQAVKSQIIQNNTRVQDLLYSVVTTK